MSHMPATSPVVPPGSIDHIYNARAYGAAGDGVADDTTAIGLAIAAARSGGGGTVYLPSGTYKTTSTLLLNASDVAILGVDAEIIFAPTAPIVSGANDRAIYIHSGDTGAYSSLRNVSGAIAVAATSFVAASAGDVSDLVAGDWLTIEETDPGVTPAGEIIFFDWVQVASVVGTTVNVMSPFRTAFPGTHATVQFRRITNVVKNVEVRDVRIRSTYTGSSLPHIVVGIAREVLLENVTMTSAKGNAIASYRSADLTVKNCHQRSNLTQATEFAATVGLTIQGCTFATYDQASTGAQLVIDYGTAFFNISGNHIGPAGNLGCMILYGCHDGTFEGNVIDYVRDAGVTNTVGLLVQGCERIIIAHNILRGGAGPAAEGITVNSASSGFSVALASTGNLVLDNIVANFANQYGTKGANDNYRTQSGGATTFWGAVACRSTIAIDGNATAGNDPATNVHTVNGKVQVNSAVGGQTLVVTGATNGQNDGVIKAQSNKTGWGTITGQLQTVAGGSTSADKFIFSIDSGVIVFRPGGGTDGITIAHNGDITLASSKLRLGGGSGPLLQSGSGTPEGNVTAPVGSLYMRTDGGAGTSHYVKESGTGNTGWVAK
jgi:hypothetical protein